LDLICTPSFVFFGSERLLLVELFAVRGNFPSRVEVWCSVVSTRSRPPFPVASVRFSCAQEALPACCFVLSGSAVLRSASICTAREQWGMRQRNPAASVIIFFSAALRFYFCCVDFLQSSTEISRAQLWWPLVSDFWAGFMIWAFLLGVRWRESFCRPALLHRCLPVSVLLCVKAAGLFRCLHLVVAHGLLLDSI
jgi:hypothetical protein